MAFFSGFIWSFRCRHTGKRSDALSSRWFYRRLWCVKELGISKDGFLCSEAYKHTS